MLINGGAVVYTVDTVKWSTLDQNRYPSSNFSCYTALWSQSPAICILTTHPEHLDVIVMQ